MPTDKSNRNYLQDEQVRAVTRKLVQLAVDEGCARLYIMHDRADHAELGEGDIRYYTLTVRPGNTGELDRKLSDLITQMCLMINDIKHHQQISLKEAVDVLARGPEAVALLLGENVGQALAARLH